MQYYRLGPFNRKENENNKNGFNGTGAQKANARKTHAGHYLNFRLAHAA